MIEIKFFREQLEVLKYLISVKRDKRKPSRIEIADDTLSIDDKCGFLHPNPKCSFNIENFVYNLGQITKFYHMNPEAGKNGNTRIYTFLYTRIKEFCIRQKETYIKSHFSKPIYNIFDKYFLGVNINNNNETASIFSAYKKSITEKKGRKTIFNFSTRSLVSKNSTLPENFPLFEYFTRSEKKITPQH